MLPSEPLYGTPNLRVRYFGTGNPILSTTYRIPLCFSCRGTLTAASGRWARVGAPRYVTSIETGISCFLCKAGNRPNRVGGIHQTHVKDLWPMGMVDARIPASASRTRLANGGPVMGEKPGRPGKRDWQRRLRPSCSRPLRQPLRSSLSGGSLGPAI
jgi:hypothetical protein